MFKVHVGVANLKTSKYIGGKTIMRDWPTPIVVKVVGK